MGAERILKDGLASLTVALVALVAALPSAASASADVEEAIRFGICPANISNVIVTKEEGGGGLVRLAIALNSAGSEELQSLSEQHLGEVIEVVFDGAILVRASLTTSITSGKLLSRRWSSAAAAEGLAKLLGNNTLGVPCGPMGK
jgi:hypothetical protein